MPNLFKHILLSTLTVLALGSCVKEERNDPAPDPTRVLLVYVGVDNNLNYYETEKLKGLREGWTRNTSDYILAYVDKRNEGAALYDLSVNPGSKPLLLATYGAENSASAATLSRVIADVTESYPADNYGLLIFSHASGWLPQGTYNEFSAGRIPDSAVTPSGVGANSRSVIIDGSNEIELTDFAAAIPDGVFDYIVFEACFMAGIEVAYELRNKAPFILASSAEIMDPGFAPVYSRSTGKLLGGNISGFAQDAFGKVMTYADNGSRSSTLSVVRTDGMDALAAFIRENCNFTNEVDVSEVQHFDRLNGYRLFFDFTDYYGRLLDTDAQRTELARLVDDCVTWKDATETFFMTGSSSDRGFMINNHSGLTTYIPQEQFAGLNQRYNALEWASAIFSE